MTDKPKLLFLAHRIPYPPNKGEKLRAYHLIRGLAERYDIWLGAPVDEADDWRWRDALDGLCVETHMADGRGRSRHRSALSALARREPVSFAYFRHPSLMGWVARVTGEHRFDAALLYSSGTMPYLDAMTQTPDRLIVDFVDVDSQKWRVLGEAGGVMGRVYAREAKLMQRAERELAQRADASLLVTDAEAALFTQVTGHTENIHAIGNGVDIESWQDAAALPTPYPADDRRRVIFTGAMDYVPNVEAVSWFAGHVMPILRAEGRNIDFIIAGSKPTKAVTALGAQDDITVTGRVEDMRPYLAHADVAVAPLHLARGVQNKVLEAMAAGTPAVVTQGALDGIDHDGSVTLATTGAEFASAITTLLDDPTRARALGIKAQAVIAEKYSWAARIEALERVIAGDDPLSARNAA